MREKEQAGAAADCAAMRHRDGKPGRSRGAGWYAGQTCGADEKKTAKDAATSKTMAKSKETAKPKAKGRQAAGKGMKT